MTARRRPARSRVRLHPFVPDTGVPADWQGREFCRRCRLPGRAGDDRHPMPAYPTIPAEVVSAERRRLGERDDERT